MTTKTKESVGTTGKIPKYKLILSDMIHNIEKGIWARNAPIPPIGELEKMYPGSRMTILKTMHLLEKEGYVRVQHGRGTKVRNELPLKYIGILCGDNIFSSPPPYYSAALCNTLSEKFKELGFQAKIYIVENYDTNSDYPNASLGDDIENNKLKALAIVSTGRLENFCNELLKQNMPFVDIGGNTQTVQHCTLNHTDFIKSSIKYLQKKGKRKIAVMGTVLNEDSEIYMDQNLKKSAQWFYADKSNHDGSYSIGKNTDMVNYEELGFKCMKEIIQSKIKIDALIICDDILAKGAAQALYGAKQVADLKFPVLTKANTKVELFYPTKFIKYEFDTEKFIKLVVKQLMLQMDGKPITALKPFNGIIKI